MKRLIGFDGRMWQHTGIGTYIRGLFQGFSNTGCIDKKDLILYGDPQIKDDTGEIVFHPFSAPIYSVREQMTYPFLLNDCRLWHAPHYNVPVIKGKTRVVVTIHDLIHWIFRNEFFSAMQTVYARQMLMRAVHHTDHIIAVSNQTKRDLIKYFNADADKISVIYESVLIEKNADMSSQSDLPANMPENYFLYVGSLKPHKNILWLIRLHQDLWKKGRISTPLVVVGRKDQQYPKGFEELRDLKSSDSLIHLQNLPYADLCRLYDKALSLVHPSLYEGFGLTLLEAMQKGVPVIALNVASIPEVAGQAAYLVEPRSDFAMIEALQRVESDAGLRENLKKKGLERVNVFSWEKAAKETVAIYDRVLSTK